MTDLPELYTIAEQHNIDIDWFSMKKAESLSIPLSFGSCAIAIDPWRLCSLADERTKLAHEIGHCETGSFYNQYSPQDIRQKHENRADKWAIKKLISKDELIEAVEQGKTEIWELAEYFSVTEDFMRKAVDLYQYVKVIGFD